MNDEREPTENRKRNQESRIKSTVVNFGRRFHLSKEAQDNLADCIHSLLDNLLREELRANRNKKP